MDLSRPPRDLEISLMISNKQDDVSEAVVVSVTTDDYLNDNKLNYKAILDEVTPHVIVELTKQLFSDDN